jgi:hypothetical protein
VKWTIRPGFSEFVQLPVLLLVNERNAVKVSLDCYNSLTEWYGCCRRSLWTSRCSLVQVGGVIRMQVSSCHRIQSLPAPSIPTADAQH